MQAIAGAWDDRRDDLEAQAERLVSALGGATRLEAGEGPLSPSLLEAAERGLARDYEPAFGGFGTAPKFPPSSAIELLLRRGGEEALGMVRRTLDGMAAGGLYDVVGGGFHRYSVDARWVVPHFEKMLYDNALLISAYLHAWVVTGETRYRTVVEETVGYLMREMLLSSGGFASAQDADTDGIEGLTYTWTPADWAELGLAPDLLEPFEHGRSIVRGDLDAPTKARLLDLRSQRPQPFRDDKAIASWNGLALAALAESARRIERDDWLEAAVRLGDFLLGPLRGEDGRVLRSIRDGRVSGGGFLDDHANVAHGLVELHVATGDVRWLLEARRIADRAIELFADDERGGFFLAPHDGEALAARSKDLDDDPIPSGNSMMASVLVRLGRIWGDDAMIERGEGVLRLLAPAMERVPASVLLGALRSRPPSRAAARACDRRPRALGGRTRGAGAVRPEERGRRWPVRRGPAARGEEARRRSRCGVRLRALHLPRARDERGRAARLIGGRGSSGSGPVGPRSELHCRRRWVEPRASAGRAGPVRPRRAACRGLDPLRAACRGGRWRRLRAAAVVRAVTQLARTRHREVTMCALPSVPRGWVGVWDGTSNRVRADPRPS